MKKIGFLSVIILLFGLGYFYIKPVDANLQPTKEKSTEKSLQGDQKQQQEAVNLAVKDPNTVKPEISEEALNAYDRIFNGEWLSVVEDFEQGRIAKSNMSQFEKDKLCDFALIKVPSQEVERLFQANCFPTGGYVSNLLINSKTKNQHGEMDQQEIISKLEIFQARGLLKYQASYNRQMREDRNGEIVNTLYDHAVSIGANDVMDYLDNIGVQPAPGKNPIFTQLTGSNSISTIHKLVALGYKPNQNVQDFMQKNDYKETYPDIYKLLSP